MPLQPYDGPIWAFYGQRAADRKATKGERIHAVTLFAYQGGAMDSECGAMGVVPAGVDWDPEHPMACPRCVAWLRGEVEVPEEIAEAAAFAAAVDAMAAQLAAKLARPAPARRSATPSLFAAVA